jgi:hypothetical protein
LLPEFRLLGACPPPGAQNGRSEIVREGDSDGFVAESTNRSETPTNLAALAATADRSRYSKANVSRA